MASLSLRHVYKKYPGNVVAVKDFNLEIEDKEFIIFVGPSGCGKSTTLRMIAGLEDISEGELYIGDTLANDVPPKDRDIAMVFQSYALYPHMSVRENMAFGLKLRKYPKAEIDRRVEEAAQILDISHLLDEPLSNLDAKLRAQMRTEISKLHLRLGTTFIYVTHDQTEAMTLGDKIVVMKDGLIQQVNTPQFLYDKPCNMFVAGFIGSPQMNFIDVKLEKRGDHVYALFGNYAIKLPISKNSKGQLDPYIGKEVVLGVRPEHVHDEPEYIERYVDSCIEADVEVTELMGNETFLYLNALGSSVTARVAPTSKTKAGDHVKVALVNSKIHIFDKETELTIVN